jgi:hypothetical protein
MRLSLKKAYTDEIIVLNWTLRNASAFKMDLNVSFPQVNEISVFREKDTLLF